MGKETNVRVSPGNG